MQKKTKYEELMKPNSNFKQYRDLISAKPKEVPCVPYLALILRDVEFINEGNQGELDENKKVTTFEALIHSYRLSGGRD